MIMSADKSSGRTAMEASGLAIGYPMGRGKGWKTVHPRVDFILRSGELTSLIGLNGAGKSTLLRTICGFQPAVSGSVRVMGRELHEYSPHELALTVGVVLTDRTNAGGLTVRELVALGRQPHTGFLGRLAARDHEVVSEAMEAVGIAHKAGSYVSELSDGERQRAMIAKALAQECPVIVLDEPTAFLDVASRIETMSLLHDTARRQGKAILLSTHDIDNALMFSDRLLLLSSSSGNSSAEVPAGGNYVPVVSGTPEDLVLDGSLREFFSRRGMNFDMRSGRLSTGVSGPAVGVEGDGLTARWMSNALARNGFTPVLPSSGIPCVRCLSPTGIEVQLPSGKSANVSGISQAMLFLESAFEPES